MPSEQIPHASKNAVPKQSPLQSWSLLASCPELPSEQIPQSSTKASPKQSPLQSWSAFGVLPVLPPEQTPQSSYCAHPISSHIPLPLISSWQTNAQSFTWPNGQSHSLGFSGSEHTPHSSISKFPLHSPLQS